jgi:hypothetical protein
VVVVGVLSTGGVEVVDEVEAVDVAAGAIGVEVTEDGELTVAVSLAGGMTVA